MSSFREIINKWLEGNGPEKEQLREAVDEAIRNNEDAAKYLAAQMAMEDALEEIADEERVSHWRQAHRDRDSMRRRRKRWWLGGAGLLCLLLLLGIVWLWDSTVPQPGEASVSPTGDSSSVIGTVAQDTILGEASPPDAPTQPANEKQNTNSAVPEASEKESPGNESWLLKQNPATLEKARLRYRWRLIVATSNDWQNAFAAGRYEEAVILLEKFFENNLAADFPEQAFILGLLKLLYIPETNYIASVRLLNASRQGISLAPDEFAWIGADIEMWRYLAFSRMEGESAQKQARALQQAHPGVLDSLRVFLSY